MAILFKKSKKFQTGGMFDKLSSATASALGVQYVGKHPRSLASTVKAEQAKQNVGYYDTNNKNLHVINKAGKEVTEQVMQNANAGDVYAANTEQFPQYANEVKALFGGNVIRRPVSIEWDPEYVKNTSRGDIGEAYGYKENIGQMIYQADRNAPIQKFPLTAENYLKYQKSLGPLFQNRNQADDLESSFYQKKTY